MTLRVSPELKAAAELAADRDHRSLTGLIEVLIINHCKNQKIPVTSSRRISNEPN
jgi:predicted HicB family RNase H-like nuclease